MISNTTSNNTTIIPFYVDTCILYEYTFITIYNVVNQNSLEKYKYVAKISYNNYIICIYFLSSDCMIKKFVWKVGVLMDSIIVK